MCVVRCRVARILCQIRGSPPHASVRVLVVDVGSHDDLWICTACSVPPIPFVHVFVVSLFHHQVDLLLAVADEELGVFDTLDRYNTGLHGLVPSLNNLQSFFGSEVDVNEVEPFAVRVSVSPVDW